MHGACSKIGRKERATMTERYGGDLRGKLTKWIRQKMDKQESDKFQKGLKKTMVRTSRK